MSWLRLQWLLAASNKFWRHLTATKVNLDVWFETWNCKRWIASKAQLDLKLQSIMISVILGILSDIWTISSPNCISRQSSVSVLVSYATTVTSFVLVAHVLCVSYDNEHSLHKHKFFVEPVSVQHQGLLIPGRSTCVH